MKMAMDKKPAPKKTPAGSKPAAPSKSSGRK